MRTTPWLRGLFTLGLWLIPFSGIAGVRALGEMAHEASAYVFLPALLFAGSVALTRSRRGGGSAFPRVVLLPRLAGVFWSIVAVSFLVNFGEISTITYQGRAGIEKFFSANLTIVYSFGLALLTYLLADERWPSFLAKPIAVSVGACFAFAVLEVLARWYGVGTGLYAALSGVIHGGFGEPKWDERLRSLAFEPPWLGNYLGFAWPWVLGGWLVSRGKTRLSYGLTLLACVLLLFGSMARTGFVMLAGETGVYFLLRSVYLSPQVESPRGAQAKRITSSFLILLGLLFILAVVFTRFGAVVGDVIASDSTTNISRLSSILAGFKIFGDYPLLGAGLGQYGFHLEPSLPYWAYYSPEFSKPGDVDGLWPSSYSIYARFAAELGIVGLGFWVGLWFWLVRRVCAISRFFRQATGRLPALAYPLVMSAFGVLLSGLSTESLRSPMIWITLGMACRYLATAASSAELDRINPAAKTSSLER
jgi:hypothetical protein